VLCVCVMCVCCVCVMCVLCVCVMCVCVACHLVLQEVREDKKHILHSVHLITVRKYGE
jgi:hypothetical protein